MCYVCVDGSVLAVRHSCPGCSGRYVCYGWYVCGCCSACYVSGVWSSRCVLCVRLVLFGSRGMCVACVLRVMCGMVVLCTMCVQFVLGTVFDMCYMCGGCYIRHICVV